MREIEAKIFSSIEKKSPHFGSVVLSLIFHDGRIVKWDITTTESHNVYQQKDQGESKK